MIRQNTPKKFQHATRTALGFGFRDLTISAQSHKMAWNTSIPTDHTAQTFFSFTYLHYPHQKFPR